MVTLMWHRVFLVLVLHALGSLVYQRVFYYFNFTFNQTFIQQTFILAHSRPRTCTTNTKTYIHTHTDTLTDTHTDTHTPYTHARDR